MVYLRSILSRSLVMFARVMGYPCDETLVSASSPAAFRRSLTRLARVPAQPIDGVKFGLDPLIALLKERIGILFSGA
jgi:hypothetical protein